MKNHLFACIALISISLCPNVFAAGEPLTDSDPESWLRPKVVVAPEYPPEAIEKKLYGYVDVDLIVTDEGFAGEIRSVTSTPKNEAFEEAVRKVISLWTFHAPMSNCRPYETVGNVRVWFEMKGDAGTVSVSNRTPLPATAAAVAGPKSKLVSTNLAAVRQMVRYPVRARRAGANGQVVIKFTVDPATGEVASKEIAVAKSRPAGYEDDFAAVAMAVVTKLKLEPMPDRDKPVVACYPFKFLLN